MFNRRQTRTGTQYEKQDTNEDQVSMRETMRSNEEEQARKQTIKLKSQPSFIEDVQKVQKDDKAQLKSEYQNYADGLGSSRSFDSSDEEDTQHESGQTSVDRITNGMVDGDLETQLWYKKVMKWTVRNRRSYGLLKSLQICISLLLLGITIILYLMKWKKTIPDDQHMVTARFAMGILGCDILVYLCDFFMIIKRWKFFIGLRYIVSTASFALALMFQAHFYQLQNVHGVIAVDFKRPIIEWLLVICLYIYQSYLVGCTINLIMYCQILDMERRDKAERKALMKKLAALKATEGV